MHLEGLQGEWMSEHHNLDATVFVYEHKTTGEIKAIYHESAVSFSNSQAASDWTHVGTLEPRMWIQAYWKDVV